MNNCVYCGRTKETVAFTREHVIPRLLGSFSNSPTIEICKECNSNIFSPLEIRFKEDTNEGITCQMLNFQNKHEIRVRNDKFKLSMDLGIEEILFNETFPFFTFTDGKLNIKFVPQIRINGYGDDGYIILLIDNLKKLSPEGKDFRKLKKFLSNKQSKDVSVFVQKEGEDHRSPLDEAYALVRELGIDYKPGEEKNLDFKDGVVAPKVEIEIEVNVGADTGRVLAKMAFNYLIFCARSSNLPEIVNHKNFNRIKQYILGELEIPIRDIFLEDPTFDSHIADEAEEGKRLIAHIVILQIINNELVASISFMGRMVYKIKLGEIPDELNLPTFGNGHVFNPVTGDIHGLTRNPTRRGANEKLNFSLFNGN